MLRLPRMRLFFVLPVLLATVMPVLIAAQDDPNDVPLGDVARNMRRKSPPPQDVIDNDNLSKVMNQAEASHTWASVLKVLTGESANHVSTPNVTCSLSFNASPKLMLSSQYAQMDLPASDVRKLEGPARIEGGTLTVSVLNRTDWHVSEVDVALTVISKKADSQSLLLDDPAAYSGPHTPATWQEPLSGGTLPNVVEAVPEKKPDQTVIYHMRAAAPPSATTAFSAPLNFDLAPDQEWHWAIVQAKGYPPQYPVDMAQATEPTGEPTSIDSPLPATLLPPQGPATRLSQNPR